MSELLIATKNQGKLREIRELLKDFNLKITSLADYPDHPEIIENGTTFHDNAVKKTVTIGRRYPDKLIMGEDSGLEVKALNWEPGVYSARFSGDNATDKKNNAKLLRLLRGVSLENRQARYRCFVALSIGEKLIAVVNGTCNGLITVRSHGKNGFGYDPLFLIPRYQKTFGQLAPQIKAQLSHRAKALKKLRDVLRMRGYL